MTVLIVVETVLLAVLTVLVAGLLRAYATVLRRLHRLDGGSGAGAARQFRLDDAPAPASDDAVVAVPAARADWTAAHDVAGRTVRGELVSTRVVGVEHDTVLLFLSSGCASCEVFWHELSAGVQLPDRTRLVIVAQDDDVESPTALAAPDLDVILSSRAWRDYEVPGSPHVVYVDGRTGRVRGEGTGQSWRQVAQLLARSSGDASFLDGRPRPRKPSRDAETEAAVDRELLAAGILPGDPRLYGELG
jgi:hypothetical protein